MRGATLVEDTFFWRDRLPGAPGAPPETTETTEVTEDAGHDTAPPRRGQRVYVWAGEISASASVIAEDEAASRKVVEDLAPREWDLANGVDDIRLTEALEFGPDGAWLPIPLDPDA
jgi:hypothetical protein